MLLFFAALTASLPDSSIPTPPAPPREFRAAWVATVDNIDWPSKRTLSASEQKAELIRIIDRAAELHLNALIFQVRPACDALYRSKLEPWSEYLTGQMGRRASYDPLEMAVEECHKRGIELHAWFNPYRAHHPSAKGPISKDHISRTQPELVRTYGKMLWLDPGEKAVQDHTTGVIMDVVKRYDIDGVHLDDYFYPYKEKDSAGNYIDFPDGQSWIKYRQGGGTLERDDWRRENVNTLIRRLYDSIKKSKPWVKFGISPFGIWRPGNPAQIQGYDQYGMLYADARKWLREGWVDYFAPQLYWKIQPPAQSYPVLLKWWIQQNTMGRNLWPGNYTSRIKESGWPADEIANQITVTRAQAGATGNIHFSMKVLMAKGSPLEQKLRVLYASPALVPASPWMETKRSGRPSFTWKRDEDRERVALRWKASGDIAQWVMQLYRSNRWETMILPGDVREHLVKLDQEPRAAAITPVDRSGVAGPTVLMYVPEALTPGPSPNSRRGGNAALTTGPSPNSRRGENAGGGR